MSKPPGRRARKLKSTRDQEAQRAADMAAAPSEDESAKEFEGGEGEEL
jgi:hypothetical protein